jgi:hypothetical protein
MRFAAILLSLSVWMGVSAASAEPSRPGRLEFEVTRNGSPFGVHSVVVSRAGERLQSRSSVTLRASVGPVTVYRYEHRCQETWDDAQLVALSCSTLKNGRELSVNGAVSDDALVIAGAGGEERFALGALPTTWWTRPPTNVNSLIDTETGAPMPVRITSMGRETIDVGGVSIEAERIRVQGTLAVDLWYDAQGRWVGCRFTARGQTIEYRLTSPLASAPA